MAQERQKRMTILAIAGGVLVAVGLLVYFVALR